MSHRSNLRSTGILFLLLFAALSLVCSSGVSRKIGDQNSNSAGPFASKNTSPIKGRVVRAHDGDTITVRDSSNIDHQIRLAGIDAPELAQAFGPQSGIELTSRVLNKDVIIQFQKQDRYGRLVGKVLLDGQDICLEQIEKGLAWHYAHYEAEQEAADRLTYADAETAARTKKLGLWVDPSPEPPWAFRASSRNKSGSEERQVASRPQASVNDESTNLGPVVGNKRSMLYHREDCPDHDKVSPKNREYFKSPGDAERAGYRVAGNCPR